jgi:flagellar basal-body rod modification protein FlgD
MIGKKATVNGSTVTTDGKGTAQTIGYTLDASAASVSITVSNSKGDSIRTIKTGTQKAGYETVTWDGKNSSGTLQPAGSYTIKVSATDKNGKAVSVSQKTSGIIESISFDQGYAVLHLDNGAESSASNLLKVETPATDSK